MTVATDLCAWRGLPLPPMGHDFCDGEMADWARDLSSCPDDVDGPCVACDPEGDR